MDARQKTPYFEWLRVFAAAAVVLMHTAARGFSGEAVDSGEWVWSAVWDGLVRWPVPIFMMITGAIFLPRSTSLRRVLTGYVPRMALAYLIWSGVYALHTGGDFFAKLAAGHYHLWYLPFLCGVYLALPFLQRIVSEERLADGLLAVSAVIGLLIPWLTELLCWLLPDLGGVLRSIRGHLEFAFFMDCLALVLLGHRLHRRELEPNRRRWLYLLGLLGLLVTILATVWAGRRSGAPNTLFLDFKSPANLCTAAAIFVFAKHHLHTLPKAVDRLAGQSFGIYLVHPLILELLAEGGVCIPAPWTPVLAAVVFGICALISAVLGKLPVVGKYLV